MQYNQSTYKTCFIAIKIYFTFVLQRENNSLHHTVEKLKAEIKQLREQCEELSENKADAMKELSEIKERFQTELSDDIADLMDEASNGDGMDRRLGELRAEVSDLYKFSIHSCLKRN